MSLCVLITIFARYVDLEKFPISAFYNIGMTYFLTFSMIGVLSIDLGFTISNKTNLNMEEQRRLDRLMAILWNIIYWGS